MAPQQSLSLGPTCTEEQIWKEKKHPGRKDEAKNIKFIFRSSWRFCRNFKDHFQHPGEDGEDVTGGPPLALSNQPEPSLLAIMQQMAQIMANLQATSSSEA
ncbi:hypothetical protein O181_043210 [Austropuccinia psidii MF-1]|uniref:Uncharacterized protein n=1 Tax=Austropuccinia psidii MF-1 TaxID=1389203 RepID=A0A9Q3DM37_9BASI|nr:hypothetical protein [Austropuccinia psidii MF-1]